MNDCCDATHHVCDLIQPSQLIETDNQLLEGDQTLNVLQLGQPVAMEIQMGDGAQSFRLGCF